MGGDFVGEGAVGIGFLELVVEATDATLEGVEADIHLLKRDHLLDIDHRQLSPLRLGIRVYESGPASGKTVRTAARIMLHSRD